MDKDMESGAVNKAGIGEQSSDISLEYVFKSYCIQNYLSHNVNQKQEHLVLH